MNSFPLSPAAYAAAISLVSFSVGIAGCFPSYDQRGGPAIADAIRESSPPSVLDVHYQNGDFMDAATVQVTMVASVVEAEAFVCDVVKPIVRDGDPPESLGVWVWDPDEDVLAVDWDTSCP